MIIFSVILIVVSATGVAALFASRDDRVRVLVVAQPVSYGEIVEASDVREVLWTETPGVKTLPAARKSSVVGKRATVNLRPDTLITADLVTDQPLLQPGQVTVAVPLSVEQLPVRPLVPGQKVQFVSTPGKNDQATKDLPSPVDAMVVEVGKRDERSGKTVVEVAVSAIDGPTLAQRVYTERIALVVRPVEQAR